MAVGRTKRKEQKNLQTKKAKAKARYTKRRKASKHGKHEGKKAQFPA